MITKDFLLEIGVEEIPAGFIAGAIKTMKNFCVDFLKKEKLKYDDIEVFSTPRRFAVRINKLQIKQEDVTLERTGPAVRIAYSESGELSKAGLGFLRGAKASKEDVFVKKTDRGDYIAVNIFVPGKETIEILKKEMKELICKIQFSKSMRWGTHSMLFARPIRWIVALFEDEIVPLEVVGVTSSNVSYGNRFEKLTNEVVITTPKAYEETLQMVKVIVNREKRKKHIETQMEMVLKNENLTPIEDKKLLELVTDLVEFPTAVVGSFKEEYLSLPEKIITSTLSQHQKYFSVRKENHALSNHFVFISNGNPACSETIRFGNEKVITARLEDAQFFYNEDTKNDLDYYYEKLNDVTFQARLGSLKEKTDRIIELVSFFCEQLEFEEEILKKTKRAAKLCKTDLVTLMLGEKEFTKLQGYIGMNYALKKNEAKDVALAIYEHYMPRGQNDSLPSNILGSLVAIADKVDTVCGICGVGMLPTGSNDPFALRRAANGVVQILQKYELKLDLFAIIEKAFSLLNNKLEEENMNVTFVHEFFKQRVEWFLSQEKIAYDIIESVMHIDFTQIADLKQRAEDIQSFRTEDDFIKLVLGFKRVSNILAKAKQKKNVLIAEAVNQDLFEKDAERNLYNGLMDLKKDAYQLLDEKKYKEVMAKLVAMSTMIDAFFDDVLVNAKEEAVRKNRFALLQAIRKVFLKIADLSKIVVEG